jgi:aspartyl-tRNA(Asn)/glutamyl-tRNA(Gln) amidotransferase subunit A
MQSQLDRIQAWEPMVHAWVTLDAETALAAAKESEAELRSHGPEGPLHGIHVGLKDIYYTKGILTTACSPTHATFVPSYDATSVAKLKAAGAIIQGKLVTTQFAAGDPSPTRNPWNLMHTPGGSSAGSGAAVAARMCAAALGSQTGGSTLRPASYNGVVGLKPSYGRISRYGVIPLAWSLDTVGILVRSVEDAALLLQAMAGSDPEDPGSAGAPVGDYVGAVQRAGKPPRIGLLRTYASAIATPEAWARTEEAVAKLEKAGATVEEVELPDSFAIHEEARSMVMMAEVSAFHYDTFRKWPDAYGQGLQRSIRTGALLSALDYLQAQRIRRQFRNDMEPIFAKHDVLLTPTTPASAPKDLSTTGNAVFQSPWTSCGVPAMSLPIGLDSASMPLGIQLVSAPFAEELLLAAARWCETILEFNLRPPAC